MCPFTRSEFIIPKMRRQIVVFGAYIVVCVDVLMDVLKWSGQGGTYLQQRDGGGGVDVARATVTAIASAPYLSPPTCAAYPYLSKSA